MPAMSAPHDAASPFASESPVGLTRDPERDVAVAVMVAEDGRYLLQLRDPFPHIHLPDHWALFGGGIEPGEAPEHAVRRELAEELGWIVRDAVPLAVSVHAVWPQAALWRMHFFVTPFRLDELDRMRQTEGAGKGLFTLGEAACLERIAPWDLCALMLHGRRASLFGQGEDR
jgi:8-oxo-dGTP pyrophosphatase MutT (NUDIX family)